MTKGKRNYVFGLQLVTCGPMKDRPNMKRFRRNWAAKRRSLK